MVGIDSPHLLEVCRVPRLGPGGPLVYAAVKKEDGAKEFLTARLLTALAELAPKWATAAKREPLVLDIDPLGQPLLRLGDQPGPSISFSEAGGLLWGVLAAVGRVGVDAALEEEFAPPYPYSKAFGPDEWAWAWRHCHGRSPAAATLLWAVKETAVKALGVGFHKLAPRDLEVSPPSSHQDGLLLRVKAPDAVISVWARPLKNGWLALALA